MFIVPTISFRLLYGLLILRHSRRKASVAGCDRTPDNNVLRQSFVPEEIPGNGHHLFR
jgi:hypothetical protein